jgi:hypothetical protein
MTTPATEVVVNAGSALYHGTPASDFTHDHLAPSGPSPIHYEHAKAPDAPGWFAQGVFLPMHAGVRFIAPNTAAKLWFHVYKTTKQLKLMSFDDMNAFDAFLGQMGGHPRGINGVTEAVRLAKQGLFGPDSVMDGYVVQSDVVRHEPEIVLFDTAINAKLAAADPIEIDVVPVVGAAPHAQSQLRGATTHNVIALYTYSGGPGTLV